jgi:hypothetical protein
MPTFMAIHKVPPKSMTLDQIRTMSRMAQNDPTVKGRHSYCNLSEGCLVCVLDASNRADVANFFEKNRVPCESITQVEFEGDGKQVNPI